MWRPGVLRSIRSQRFGHDRATEQQKQISNKDLLYSTRKYIDYLIITIMEKNIYIYIYMNHFAVYLKLIQHCQSSILQFLKNVFKKRNNGDFSSGAVGKNQPASVGDMCSNPGLGRFHTLQSS